MSTDKLSELKAVADYWRKVKSGELPAPGPNEISITVCTLDGAVSRITALLAELEAKDKRIDELSHWLEHNIERAKAAEQKLATPVRLKKVDSSNVPFAGDGFNAAVDYCAKAVRAAGFKCVGDE
jgi:hypothetical protein